MSKDWHPIEQIPEELMDGREVWVKRMSPTGTRYSKNGVVAEGWAVFAICHPLAPQRRSLGVDPLGRLSSSDYVREDREVREYSDRPKWLKPDRMYSFPTPTHFALPEGEKP